MDLLEQRKFGLKLAQGLKARRTLTTIGCSDACYEAILTTAADEVGVDALVQQLLQGPAEWSLRALQCVPGIAAHRDALLGKIASEAEVAHMAMRRLDDLGSQRAAIANAALAFASPQGAIAGFKLTNNGGYTCAFTVMWMHGTEPMPSSVYPNSSSWHWSADITNPFSTGNVNISEFAIPGTVLSPGDVVWMRMWVLSGYNLFSKEQFIYDPNSTQYAAYSAAGTTLSDSLTFTGLTASARASADAVAQPA